MKLLAALIFAGFVAASGAALAEQAPTGQPPGRAMFVVIDYERLVTDTRSLSGLYAALEDARTQQAAAHNLALDGLEETFAPFLLHRDEVPPEDYEAALKAFNDAVAEMEKTLSEVEAELNKAADAAIKEFDQVRQAVEAEIIAKYRVEQILDETAALYVRPGSGYDVTDEVIRRIDERLPELALPKPEPTPDEAGPEAAPAT